VPVPEGAVDVAASAAVPSSPPWKAVTAGGERLLLLRHPAGHVVAVPNACPHLGQPLRKAGLDGTVLTCRHHRHRYDLDGGACVWPGGADDEPLEVRESGEVDGRVWVRVAGPGGEVRR
jgi:phenylpropionate dioxygenase-like ring-hydroxylating dioxygenase large terminal subunit